MLQGPPPHLPGRPWHNHAPHKGNQGVPKTCEPGAGLLLPPRVGPQALLQTGASGAGFLTPGRSSSPPPPQQPVVTKSLSPAPACTPTPASVLTSHLAKRLEKLLTLPDPEFIDWSGPIGHRLTVWAEGVCRARECPPGFHPAPRAKPSQDTHCPPCAHLDRHERPHTLRTRTHTIPSPPPRKQLYPHTKTYTPFCARALYSHRPTRHTPTHAAASMSHTLTQATCAWYFCTHGVGGWPALATHGHLAPPDSSAGLCPALHRARGTLAG